MTTTTLNFRHEPGGVLTDVTSAVLCDATNTYGVQRTDTGAAVVAINTPLVNIGTGVYSYAFTDPAGDLSYLYVVKYVYLGVTYYQPLTATGGATVTNVYATLAELKAQLQITAATWDTVLSAFLNSSSRGVDDFCGRTFYTTSATRRFASHGGYAVQLPDDLLTVTTMTTDSELDQTFDGETWVEGTDFVLLPYNSNPKWEIKVHPTGRYSFGVGNPYIQIVGTWGYDSTVPEAVKMWTLWDASEMFGDYQAGRFGLTQERQGEYFYARRQEEQYQLHRLRVLGPYVRRLG